MQNRERSIAHSQEDDNDVDSEVKAELLYSAAGTEDITDDVVKSKLVPDLMNSLTSREGYDGKHPLREHVGLDLRELVEVVGINANELASILKVTSADYAKTRIKSPAQLSSAQVESLATELLIKAEGIPEKAEIYYRLKAGELIADLSGMLARSNEEEKLALIDSLDDITRRLPLSAVLTLKMVADELYRAYGGNVNC